MQYKTFLFAIACAVQGCSSGDIADVHSSVKAKSTDSIQAQAIKIYRDDYGTPHVFANSNFDLFTGYGYAVAQDRLFQMEMLKRTTQGEVAEVLGSEYINFDHFTRSQFNPGSIIKQIKKLNPAQLDVLNGYAKGMNLWINEIAKNNKQLLPFEFTQHDFKPSKWDAYDVAMIFVGTLAMRYADFNTELENLETLQSLKKLHGKEQSLKLFNALMWQCDSDSITTVHNKSEQQCIERNKIPDDLSVESPINLAMSNYIDISGELNFSANSNEKWLKDFSITGLSGDIARSSASNIWVLAKDKLKEVNGVMLNGPQFGWANPSYVYGIGLHGGDYNIVGSTLLATPNILFGHNNKIAWGATAGFADQVDVIQLDLIKNTTEPSALFYHYQGKEYKVSERQEMIKVKNSDPVKSNIRYTHLGAIEQVDEGSDHIYIRRRAWQGFEVNSMLAWLDVGKANNWSQFRQEVSQVATNINFYYMDLDGNLGYNLAGRYPVRHLQQHQRLPMTVSTDWQGMQKFEENAYEYKPANGFIMNWNNRPESKVSSPDMWWKTWAKADRANEIEQRLSQQSKWSVDDVWQLNEEMSFNDNNIRYLLPLLEQVHKDSRLSPQEAEGLALLQNWDKAWRDEDHNGYFDSNATTLMQHWLSQLLKDVLSDDLPEKIFKKYAATGYPIATIRGSIGQQPGTVIVVDNLYAEQRGKQIRFDFLNGKTALEVIKASFSQVIDTFTKDGQLVIADTKVFPLMFSPYNFRGVLQGSAEHKSGHIMNRGAENNLFVATKSGFQAWDVNPSGQSAFINQQGIPSPHVKDQLPMFENFQKKPIYWSESELKKQGFSVEIINSITR